MKIGVVSDKTELGIHTIRYYDYLKLEQNRFVIGKGYSMTAPLPSCIEVSICVENDAISSLLAGGVGIASRHQTIEI